MSSSTDHISTPSDRSHDPAALGIIRVGGADRLSFLQGQLTQDLDQLRPDKPLLTGWANPKGRLRSLCWMIDWQDAVWLIMPAELVDTVNRQLAMYVLRADAQVGVADMGVFAVPGTALEALPEFKDNSDERRITSCFISGNCLFFLPDGLADAALLLTADDAAGLTIPQLAWNEWRHMNILAGIPSVWAATSGEFVPQMLNLELLNGISFSKGCYVGQEIVARTQNLGRIKRRMLRFQTVTDVALNPGANLYSGGAKAGQVVDAVSAGGHTELLAVVSLDKLQDELSADNEGQVLISRVALPYTIPELPE